MDNTPARRTKPGDLTVRQMSELRAKIHRYASGYPALLDSYIRGRCELTRGQLKAVELLLSRAVPTLASTEISAGDGFDGATESELVERLRLLLVRHPELAAALGRDAVAAHDAANAKEVPEEQDLEDAMNATVMAFNEPND